MQKHLLKQSSDTTVALLCVTERWVLLKHIRSICYDFYMYVLQMPVRIALLGCGPCGMATLYQYAKMPKDKRPEIVCYEKQKTWGGLWNFSWRIGIHVKITYLRNAYTLKPLDTTYILVYMYMDVHGNAFLT